jgi:hypothetical protein
MDCENVNLVLIDEAIHDAVGSVDDFPDFGIAHLLEPRGKILGREQDDLWLR